MMKMPESTRSGPTVRGAFVREVPSGFGRSHRLTPTPTRIDLGRAREQHARYARALRSLGVSVTMIPADDGRAESVWIADVAVLVGRRHAIICRPAAVARIGEADAFAPLLAEGRTLHEMPPGALLDGSDVLDLGDRLLVALSQRTNAAGTDLLEKVARLEHLQVVRVQIRGLMRLRSVCSHLGDGVLLHAAGSLARDAVPGVENLPAPEAQGASVLVGGPWAIIADEAPRTASLLERRGIEVVRVPLSEFLKAQGGPSRMSLCSSG